MSRLGTHVLPFLLLGVVLTTIGGMVTFAVFASGKPSAGPFEVVWDKTPCAACGMHVGEPPFAAQLTTQDGATHAFDDPGCLFLFVAEQQPAIHTVFFHHHSEPRWIAERDVAFLPVEKSPMGFGLAATDVSTRGAIDCDEARRKCLERTSGHGGK